MTDRKKAEKIIERIKKQWGDSANEAASCIEELLDQVDTMRIAGSMRVLHPGDKVELADGIVGIILEVLIKDDYFVQYRISWWDGRRRCSEWLDAFEFDHEKPTQDMLRIGFLRDAQKP